MHTKLRRPSPPLEPSGAEAAPSPPLLATVSKTMALRNGAHVRPNFSRSSCVIYFQTFGSRHASASARPMGRRAIRQTDRDGSTVRPPAQTRSGATANLVCKPVPHLIYCPLAALRRLPKITINARGGGGVFSDPILHGWYFTFSSLVSSIIPLFFSLRFKLPGNLLQLPRRFSTS